MNRITAGEVSRWNQKRQDDMRNWMKAQGVDPRDTASITLNDDGTFDAELFTRDDNGKRQIDPNDSSSVLTVIINYTPNTPCPEEL